MKLLAMVDYGEVGLQLIKHTITRWLGCYEDNRELENEIRMDNERIQKINNL